ncbi:mucin-5AC-like, partial [Limulus polyphemus]|uniref:Mucin-5AC-like n=1 Tax=Limulus polyphemus TaxID=6850 RepID=A0ABM1C2G5_LIMPO
MVIAREVLMLIAVAEVCKSFVVNSSLAVLVDTKDSVPFAVEDVSTKIGAETSVTEISSVSQMQTSQMPEVSQETSASTKTASEKLTSIFVETTPTEKVTESSINEISSGTQMETTQTPKEGTPITTKTAIEELTTKLVETSATPVGTESLINEISSASQMQTRQTLEAADGTTITPSEELTSHFVETSGTAKSTESSLSTKTVNEELTTKFGETSATATATQSSAVEISSASEIQTTQLLEEAEKTSFTKKTPSEELTSILVETTQTPKEGTPITTKTVIEELTTKLAETSATPVGTESSVAEISSASQMQNTPISGISTNHPIEESTPEEVETYKSPESSSITFIASTSDFSHTERQVMSEVAENAATLAVTKLPVTSEKPSSAEEISMTHSLVAEAVDATFQSKSSTVSSKIMLPTENETSTPTGRVEIRTASVGIAEEPTIMNQLTESETLQNVFQSSLSSYIYFENVTNTRTSTMQKVTPSPGPTKRSQLTNETTLLTSQVPEIFISHLTTVVSENVTSEIDQLHSDHISSVTPVSTLLSDFTESTSREHLTTSLVQSAAGGRTTTSTAMEATEYSTMESAKTNVVRPSVLPTTTSVTSESRPEEATTTKSLLTSEFQPKETKSTKSESTSRTNGSSELQPHTMTSSESIKTSTTSVISETQPDESTSTQSKLTSTASGISELQPQEATTTKSQLTSESQPKESNSTKSVSTSEISGSSESQTQETGLSESIPASTRS